MFSKSLIQFSVDGWGYIPALLFNLRSNYGGGNEDYVHLLQKFPCMIALPHSVPPTCSWPPLTHAFTGDFWTFTGKFGLVSCGVTAPFSWGPGAHKVLFVPSNSLFLQSCISSVIKSHLPPKSNSMGVLSPFARSPGWEICVGPRTFLTVQEFL